MNAGLRGFPTVTVSEAVPLSVTEKLFDSEVSPFERLISLKATLDGFTLSSLNGFLVLASSSPSCANAVAIAMGRRLTRIVAINAVAAIRTVFRATLTMAVALLP